MASLSRTVLVIGTLAASAVCAQAGDKAAFNAPVRDAMPDITPIVAAAPEVPVAAPSTPTPTDSKVARGKHVRGLARSAVRTAVAAASQPATVARLASSAPAGTVPDAAGQGAAETAAAVAASSSDTVAELESKSAGIGPATLSSTDLTSRGASSASTRSIAIPNTEAASRTPGPPPAAKPDGPRERASGTVADLVAKHALANGVPVKLAQAVVRIESRGNAHASNAGALGLMQIKFGTARAAGFSGPAVGLFVADTNLHFGMKILGDAYRAAGGDTCGALMRYQSGHLATRMNRANQLYCSRARAIMAGA